MGKKDYLIGDKLTFIDFYTLELCDFIQWVTNNEFYNENGNVARYVKRMKGLESIKNYIESDRYLELPFNNKSAKINNL